MTGVITPCPLSDRPQIRISFSSRKPPSSRAAPTPSGGDTRCQPSCGCNAPCHVARARALSPLPEASPGELQEASTGPHRAAGASAGDKLSTVLGHLEEIRSENARLRHAVEVPPYPRKALRTSIKNHVWKISSTFGDKCP